MRHSVRNALLVVLLITCVVLAVKGSSLLILSGTWQATGNLSSARFGSGAILLQDGRILVTGGDPGNGPLASADFLLADGSTSPAPPMVMPRSSHFAVTLQDGRVLVGGGTTSGGSATSTAEIFDPSTNSWTNAGSGMIEARAGATAALLQDGRVLVAGGRNGTAVSSTIEIFDPTTGTFAAAGMMSSPRAQHAMAVLQDGRVLIIGGFNGSAPVASSDIFDPVAGIVSAGPALNVGRFAHSATTLLNGAVVVIGGNNGNADPTQMDVTPAELFDPSAATPAFAALPTNLLTPREGHLAILLPNNNSVLIAGGTSAGATLASAELFTPSESSQAVWSYAFSSTGPMTTGRNNAAASSNQVNAPSSTMQRNGIVMVAGGSDSSGNALSSGEGYGYPTVQTDQSDYPPGTTVTITGSGFQAGETVTIQLVESPFIDTHGPYTVQADANGSFTDSSFATDSHDLNVLFYLTAIGSQSGYKAQNTFTDANNDSNTLVITCNSGSVGLGATTTCTATETDTAAAPNNGSPLGTVTWSINPAADGTFNPTPCSLTVATSTTSTCSTTFTGKGAGAATITASYSRASNNWANNTASNSLPMTVNKGNSLTAIASSVNPSVFGQAVTFTATVSPVSPATSTPTGTVQFQIDGVNFGSPVTLSGGSATSAATSTLAVNSHSIAAIYNGDTNFTTSTSSALSQTVNKASTATTITNATTLTNTPSAVGQSVAVNFSVTATSPGSGTPTGSVTVSDGLGDSCTATVGAATCSITFNTPGSKTLSASYTGDTNFTGSSSGNASHTVNAASTTTTITNVAALGTGSVVNQPYPVNYSVAITAPGGGTIPGTDTVTVSDGTDTCTGTVAAGFCNLASTTTGNKTITAKFSGDANYTTSTSAGVPHTVGTAPTITSTNNTSFTVNSAGTFTVTATGFPTPTFTETGTLPSGVTLDTTTGVLSGTPAPGTVGTYPITITASNGIGTNATQNFTLTVSKLTPTFAALTASQTIPFGQASVALSGRVNGYPGMGGTVTIKIGGVNSPALNLSGNPNNFSIANFDTHTLLVSGSPYTITYTYSGDANSDGATDTTTTLTVTKVTPTVNWSTPAAITFNTVLSATQLNATFTAIVNGATVQVPGTATYNPAAGAILNAGAGQNLAVNFVPTDTTDYNNASGSVLITVNKAATSTAVTSNNNPSFSGQSVGLTATVSNASGTLAVPTGSVQFMDGASPLGSPQPLSGGKATLTTSTLSVATHSITAVYTNSDGNFTASTSPALSQVVKSADTTTSISAPTVTYNADGMVTVTVAAVDPSAGTPTGNVSLAVDGGAPMIQALSSGSTTFTIATPNAGDHSLSASYAAQNNFNASSNTGTLHVNQATPTVTFSGAPASAEFGSQFNVTASTNSTAGVILSAAGSCSISGTTVTITSGIGNCNLHASWPADNNYFGATADQSTAAQPAPVIITVPDTTVTYDGSAKTINVTASPAVSFLVTYTGIAGTSYGPSGSAPIEPGTYTVLAAVTDAVDYVGSRSGTLTISKKDPALVFALRTGMASQTPYGTRVYFDLTTANSPCPTGELQFLIDSNNQPDSTVTLAGTECIQAISAEFSTATLTPGTHNVYVTYAGDTHYLNENSSQVSHVVVADATMVTLATSAGQVFVGDPVTFTATVTPNSVDASATAPSGNVQFFDGNTQLGQSPVTGTVATGATATLSVSSLASGPHSITATYTSTDGLYNGSSSPVAVSVESDKIIPAITWPQPASIVYGTKLSNTQLNATAEDTHNNIDLSSSGTFTYNPPMGTVMQAGGPFNLMVTFTPTDGDTYASQTATVTITVTPATLTVTADDVSRAYGIDNPPFTFQYSGFVNNETSAVVTTMPTCASVADHTSSVGIYDINCSGGVSPNYTFNYVKGTLNVTQAPLTITAKDASKTYGSTLTLAGTEFITSALYNGDGVTSLSLTSTGAPATAAAGSYSIVPSAAVGTGLSNYTISYSNGTLTVNPAALCITAKDASKTYGQALAFAGTEFTTSTLYNSDSVTSVTLTSAGAAATASVGGSPYAIVPSAAVGTGLSNYTITYKNGMLTVNKAHLTLTADDKTKTYDGAIFSPFTATITGFANGETLATSGVTGSASFSGPAAAAVNAGSYTITPSAGTLSATNYDFPAANLVNGSLTINKAHLTVTADDKAKTYDGAAFTPFTASITGFVNNENSSVISGAPSFSGTAVGAINAGSYVVTPAVGSLSATNYDFATFKDGTLTITQADAVIAVTGYTGVYDGNAHGASGTAKGVESTPVDLTNLLNLGSSFTDVPGGTAHWSFAGNTNYKPASGEASIVITQADAAIKVNGYTGTYDANAHGATGSAKGVNNEDLSALLNLGASFTDVPGGTAHWTFAGNIDYKANAGDVPITIGQAPSVTTVTCPTSVTFNGSAQMPCTVSVTGVGGLALTPAPTYSNNMNAGVATASYTFSGDGNHTGSNGSSNFTIAQTTSTTTVVCPVGVTYNGTPQAPCSAVATGAGGLNTTIAPTYSGDCTNVTVLGCTASATYIGDANHTGSFGSATFPILPANTSTTVSSSLATSNWTNPVTLTATVKNTSTNAALTGSVSFYDFTSGSPTCLNLTGATFIETDPLTLIGTSYQAMTTTANLLPGSYTILACYNNASNADFTANFGASSGQAAQIVKSAPIVTLVPSSLSFGGQQGGTVSGAQTVTICNGPSGASGTPCFNAPTSTDVLAISGIGFTNANTGTAYFAQTNNCPSGASTLAVGGSCAANVKFAPPVNAQGIATALLTITDNNVNILGSMQSASLVGAGTSAISSVGSLSTNAIFAMANGCSTVNISGNGTVDSFNGPINNGNVATNGNVSMNGNPVINGTVYSPNAGTGGCSSKAVTGLSLSGKAQATGGLKTLAGSITYPLPPVPTPAPPTTAQNIAGSCGSIAGCSNSGSKNVSLAPGQYGNLSASGGTTVHLSAGTYNINSLTLTGNSILYVDSGPVVINISGASLSASAAATDLSGGSMVNPSGLTSNLQLYYAGSNAFKLSGGAGSYALVYAPNAAINVTGGSHFYGSIVCATINSSGNTAIHGDLSLASISGNNTIWFSSSGLNVKLPNSSGGIVLYVTNASINFTANGQTYTLPVPNAVITFSPTATSTSTTWDAANNRWSTLIPKSSVSNAAIHSFFDGIAFQVPAGGFPNGIQNVTWQAAYSTSTTGLSFNWQWGAAVYSNFAASNTGLHINPQDNAVPAGTPLDYESSLIFGDMGAGFTGLYVGTAGVVPTIAPMSFSPSSYDFGLVMKGTSPLAPVTFVLTNNDSVPYTISSIQMTGTYAADFVQTNNCPVSPNQLPAGQNCSFNLTFTANAASGTKETAKIVVNDNANNSPQTVFVKGTVQ